MMKRFQAEGCVLWALLALVVILLCTGLLVYIDRRFGPEASAFFLGLLLGIPFLLVVVLIVGGIYILVIRGATHLQERDDIGEVERLRALRELARTERSAMQNERTTFDAQRRDSRLLDAWRQRQSPPTDAVPWGPRPFGGRFFAHRWCCSFRRALKAPAGGMPLGRSAPLGTRSVQPASPRRAW